MVEGQIKVVCLTPSNELPHSLHNAVVLGLLMIIFKLYLRHIGHFLLCMSTDNDERWPQSEAWCLKAGCSGWIFFIAFLCSKLNEGPHVYPLPCFVGERQESVILNKENSQLIKLTEYPV